jgi:hypothetical protein
MAVTLGHNLRKDTEALLLSAPEVSGIDAWGCVSEDRLTLNCFVAVSRPSVAIINVGEESQGRLGTFNRWPKIERILKTEPLLNIAV